MNTMALIRSVPLLIIGASIVGQRADGEHRNPSVSEPLATTLCAVVEHPERFNGKLIRFRASFASDGLEHSILEERGCKKGIVPYQPSDDKPRPDLDAFDRAIHTGLAGTLDKDVVAVFTGRFVWKPPSKRILKLEGVTELHVTPRKEEPQGTASPELEHEVGHVPEASKH